MDLRQECEMDEKRIYVAIGDSRCLGWGSSINTYYKEGVTSVSMYDYLEYSMEQLLNQWRKQERGVICVSGDARGVDALGCRYAEKHGYEVKHFPAEWEVLGRKAGMVRNRKMCMYLPTKPNKAVVLYWDGESKGTLNMLNVAVEYCIPVRLYHVMKQRWLTEVEVKEITMK